MAGNRTAPPIRGRAGRQIKWTPRLDKQSSPTITGLGHDDLYAPNRGRIHTDNSVEIKYFDQPGEPRR